MDDGDFAAVYVEIGCINCAQIDRDHFFRFQTALRAHVSERPLPGQSVDGCELETTPAEVREIPDGRGEPRQSLDMKDQRPGILDRGEGEEKKKRKLLRITNDK